MIYKTKNYIFIVFSLLLFTTAINFTINQNSLQKEVIVLYENDLGLKAIQEYTDEIHHQFTSISAVTVHLTEEEIALVTQHPNIISVDRNGAFTIISDDFTILPETQISLQANEITIEDGEYLWNIDEINAEQAWEDGLTGENIKVAVIDTGISPHQDLHIVGGISTVNYTDSWEDDNGHGTLVAGTIAAKNNGVGITGVSPDVDLYSVKALDDQGQGTLQSVLEAIDWSIENNIDIINLSFGTMTGHTSLKSMVDNAYEQGMIIVGASGNSGNVLGAGNSVNYPAKYNSVIAIAAVNESLTRASFSSTGSDVEFAAPGVNIISTYLDSKYAKTNGTSFASPHVAGILAILKQMHPQKTNVELRDLLKTYAVDLGEDGRDPWYGYGFIKYESSEEEERVLRIGGINLYETSALISQQGWEQSDVVILARGDRFSDALTGVPLAAKYDAPLLLSRSHGLDRFTEDELIRLETKKVIILGGHLAIQPQVEEAIINLGIEVERLAGANMHVTAELIAKEVAPNGSDIAVIVTDDRFQDALSVASYAGVRGIPILLVSHNHLPLATEKALKELGVKETLVIGGELAISNEVEAKLPRPERIAGRTMFHTNIEAFNYFQPNTNNAYVATSERFPDGLSGGALAAKENVPIILVGNELRSFTRDHIIITNYDQVKVLGGELAVNESVFVEISTLIR